MSELRKTVLFIVEGPSDKTALEKIFKKIYKSHPGNTLKKNCILWSGQD